MAQKILFFFCCLVAFHYNALEKHKVINSSSLLIRFNNYEGDRLLKLDSVEYTNQLGQLYTVTMLKYYISNISLKKTDGTSINFKDSYLVNEEEPASKNLVLDKVSNGEYTGISFILGVDSVHNCSGAQAGALDPMNGMFWAWNTGYIFLKMEGRSSVSKSAGNMLEFHIGGYKQPNNCIRTVSLQFKRPLRIDKDNKPSLQVKADIRELFRKRVDIDFSKLSSVTDFHNSVMMADNYTDMFSVEQ